MKSVTFFTIEDISSGLFSTQVLNIAKYLSKNEEINIICVNRIWHYKKHIKELNKINNNKEYKNINLYYIPLLMPLRNAVKFTFYSRFVVIWLYCILSLFRKVVGCNMVIARSYWPAAAANMIHNCKVIFDPRSLWIHENLSSGDLTINTKAHKYWCELEKYIINKSDKCICVSLGMIDYFNELYNYKADYIPITVDTDKYKLDEIFRDNKRRELNIKNKTVFLYSGSFGQSGINKEYLKIIFNLVLNTNKSHLLILSQESVESIKFLLNAIDSNVNNYTIINTHLYNLGRWSSVGDIGIHALPPQLDSRTRLGTKVVEYFSMGMPVLVNDNVGAASKIVKENNLGMVVNLDKVKKLNPNDIQFLMNIKKEKIRKYALNNFSTEVCGEKHRKLIRNVELR